MPYTTLPTLSLKPDFTEAARRWDAFYAGDLLDRPLVCVTAPAEDVVPVSGPNYHERVFGDIDDMVQRGLRGLQNAVFLGEALPVYWISFGPDEIAVFCGAELAWSADSGDTNWSVPCIEDWANVDIRLDDANPLWQRLLAFYRAAAQTMAGHALLCMPDLHSNMDLLAAMRGPQRLCEDLLDCPEAIDAAMTQARAVFPKLWNGVWEAGNFDAIGYRQAFTTLQCDFSCMISPPMFRRWVLPALEEEAEIAGRVQYHWDGPGALVHTADLLASRGLHTMAYVPGDGHGDHVRHLDLYQRVQAGGKAVAVGGTPEECKAMHRVLKPEKTLYWTHASSRAEAEELLAWFVRNT
jgi:hypothetical protein